MSSVLTVRPEKIFLNIKVRSYHMEELIMICHKKMNIEEMNASIPVGSFPTANIFFKPFESQDLE